MCVIFVPKGESQPWRLSAEVAFLFMDKHTCTLRLKTKFRLGDAARDPCLTAKSCAHTQQLRDLKPVSGVSIPEIARTFVIKPDLLCGLCRQFLL